MIITYKVPREGLNADRFLETHVLPLGSALARAKVDLDRGAVVQLNDPECLILAHAAVLISAGLIDDWELTTVVDAPSGTLVGELEEGSVEFALTREGAPDLHLETFLFEIPDEPRLPEIAWRAGSKMRIVYEDDYFSIIGNSAAFLSTAGHFAMLASTHVPIGTQIRYLPGKDLEPSSLPWIIEKAVFPQRRVRG